MFLQFFGEHLSEKEREEELLLISSLQDTMPFLEMLQLQSVESQSPQFFPFKDANFQTLVQKPPFEEDKKAYIIHRTTEAQLQPQPEPESCVTTTHDVAEEGMPSPSPAMAENCRRKTKRTRPMKNKEDLENQRMTHIAVERNRRRQMNDHLGGLRSLMPPSYIQRVSNQIFFSLFFFFTNLTKPISSNSLVLRFSQ